MHSSTVNMLARLAIVAAFCALLAAPAAAIDEVDGKLLLQLPFALPARLCAVGIMLAREQG